MRLTSRLLQSCRITLFTRENCGLCTEARSVLSKVWDERPFQYAEIDIMQPGGKEWKAYEFDVPVIHIEKQQFFPKEKEVTSRPVKLMHRFTPEEVKEKMDQVEKS